ncbi:MAG TPA: TA system VapC family ribonuclease toxin [Burkholderiaceae bacterium]|jgi:toxin-antitoxin system PIN domain toxin|nr:TA system VapC family ribonuclease toxin [Burkholderiaceae bacterium]
MTPDVNVLVAASRSDHPHHGIARQWLEDALAAAGHGSPFTLMPMVLASTLRLVTSAKIFVQPTPMADAIAFLDAILAMPGVRLATLGAEWPGLRRLCLDKQPAGNDLPDAWLASAVVQQAEHLVSFDRGFRKLLGRSQFTLLKS